MQTKELFKKLFQAALEETKPKNLIAQHCKLEGSVLRIQEDEYDLLKYDRIFILGSGKAAWSMAEAMEGLIREYIHSGLIVAPECKSTLTKVECFISDHPIPTERSIRGAQALIKKMQECHKNDLYIYLLSGGTSALIEQPVDGITLDELQTTTDLMLKNALNIYEINAVRKHLSCIKGGHLGKYSQAQGLVLTISDVIGDDLYSIGSSPLYADLSTYEEVFEILKSYNIWEQMPSSVKNVLNEGVKHIRPETPKVPSTNIKHYIIGTNALARKAVYKKSLELGLEAKVIDLDIDIDSSLASQKMLDLALALNERVIIFGGETTVKVEGKGKDGRNQHTVLNMLKLTEEKGVEIAFLSAGTDGIDGNSDAAGAYIDTTSLTKAKIKGLNINTYLKENDSYHFFKQLDSLVMTGPTGNNVMDIAILIKEL